MLALSQQTLSLSSVWNTRRPRQLPNVRLAFTVTGGTMPIPFVRSKTSQIAKCIRLILTSALNAYTVNTQMTVESVAHRANLFLIAQSMILQVQMSIVRGATTNIICMTTKTATRFMMMITVIRLTGSLISVTFAEIQATSV